MFKRANASFKMISLCLVVSIAAVVVLADVLRVKDSDASVLGLPAPTELVTLSRWYSTPVLKGLKLNPANPFEIEFLIDTADKSDVSQNEIDRLVSYFMAGVATSKPDIWVNLSPYEKDRVIDDSLASTDLGRDLLAQDYILKQLSSSLTHPDTQVGKEYWLGNTVDNLNKIWISPDIAEVYEQSNVVLISNSSLKVQTEKDYIAMSASGVGAQHAAPSDILINQITKDVNQGENFTRLRQIYSAMILSEWFKSKVKDSLYSAYIDSNKTDSLELQEKGIKDKIYNLYVKSFKKGVYNFIKKEYDTNSDKKVKRVYFSGGYTNELTLSSAVSYEPKGTVCSAIVNLKALSSRGIIKTGTILALLSSTLILSLPSNAEAKRRSKSKKEIKIVKQKTPVELLNYALNNEILALKEKFDYYSNVKEGQFNRDSVVEYSKLIGEKVGQFLDSYFDRADRPYIGSFDILRKHHNDLLRAYGVKIDVIRQKALDNLLYHIDEKIAAGAINEALNELRLNRLSFILYNKMSKFQEYEAKIESKRKLVANSALINEADNVDLANTTSKALKNSNITDIANINSSIKSKDTSSALIASKNSTAVLNNGGIDMDSLSVNTTSSSSLFEFHSLPCDPADLLGFSFNVVDIKNNVELSEYFG